SLWSRTAAPRDAGQQLTQCGGRVKPGALEQLPLFMSSSRHPIVQKIRRDCAEPFAAFEQCLERNEASVMNCAEHVQRFLLCAERVKLAT
uniref:Coiled-coil-helix-coiled-coil-helix domain containing 5 n=1 Tax=Pelusios castaneus TaxID=367368 RepID=A0A8C8SC49_9SAUR